MNATIQSSFNVSIYSLFKLYFFIAFCWLVVAPLEAQEAIEKASHLEWVDTLRIYNKDLKAISIPLTERNINRIKKRLSLYQYHVLYVSASELSSSNTPSIRAGFYPRGRAAELKNDSDFVFPDQEVIDVSENEHSGVLASLDKLVSKQKDNKKQQPDLNNQYFVFPIGPNSSDIFDLTADNMLVNAKNLYIDKNYAEAAIHYHLLSIITKDKKIAAWARELLGVCQEKQKLFSQAIQTYTKLQLDFPNSNGFKRIEQRLRGLTTAASDPNNPLRKSDYYSKKRQFFSRGFIGQYYRSLSRAVNNEEFEEVNTFVTTQYDFRATTESNGHLLKARINGSHISDLLQDDGSDDDSDARLKRLNIEYLNRDKNIQAKIGRQREYDSGVFTSFDGVSASYPLLKSVRAAVSIGSPVYFFGLFEELDYFFYSAHLSWELGEHWRFNNYYITQTLDDITDREAIGLRSQYIGEKLSSSMNIDYDIAFAELNNLLWTTHYKLNDKTRFTLNYGRQRSPFLTASNIFVGQPDLNLDVYLSTQANADSLLEDALSRTSLNQYATFLIHRDLSNTVDINLSFTKSNLSDIPSSSILLDDPTLADDSIEYNFTQYGAQLIAHKVFGLNDFLTLGFRSSFATLSESIQLYIHERFLLANNKLSIIPKLSFAQTTTISSESDNDQIRYSLSIKYRPWRKAEINLELGNELISEQRDDNQIDSTYIFAGYRVSF